LLTFSSKLNQTFTVLSAAPMGAITVSFTLSSLDRAQYEQPRPLSLFSLPVNGIAVVCTPSPALYFGMEANCRVELGSAPFYSSLNVWPSVSGVGGGSVSASVLSFSTGAPQFFSWT